MLSLFTTNIDAFDFLTAVAIGLFLIAATVFSWTARAITGYAVTCVGLASLCAAFLLEDVTDGLLCVCVVLFLVAAVMLSEKRKITGFTLENVALAVLSFAFLFTTP